MRKNFGAKPYTYPQPVLIIASYDENGTPDAMNAAWGGISDDTQISMCLSAGHKTVKNILKRKAFTVSMADAANVAACDYVGIVSANDVPDKLGKAGFHTTRSEFVDAPLIDELPMALECRLVSYDEESCRMVGEIVNVSAEESVLDENGKIDPGKLQPITFDPVNNAYLKLGEKVGNAFRDGLALKEQTALSWSITDNTAPVPATSGGTGLPVLPAPHGCPAEPHFRFQTPESLWRSGRRTACGR